MARYFIRFTHADTGLLPSFIYFKNAYDLSDVMSPPGINEIVAAGAGGTYYFDYSPTFDIVYEIDGGVAVLDVHDRYISDTISPRDTWLDEPVSQVVTDVWSDNNAYTAGDKGAQLTRLAHIEEGHWKIFTVGPDANRLVLYDADGTTVLQKWDLKDSAGVASTTTIYERVPVNTVP